MKETQSPLLGNPKACSSCWEGGVRWCMRSCQPAKQEGRESKGGSASHNNHGKANESRGWWHFHLRNQRRSLLRITALLASLHAGTHNSRWTHVNRGTNFLGTPQQNVPGALWMFALFEPRILLLGIDLTEIITGTDQDLCTRKLITGLFITWEKTGNNPTRQQARKEETNYEFWGHPWNRLDSNQ